MKIHEAVGNPLDVQRWLGDIGNIHYREGDLDQAREYYQRALKIARPLSEPESVVMWLNNLATVSLNFGAIDDAERYNGEALKLREVVGDKGTRLASQIDFARVQEARQRTASRERLPRSDPALRRSA